MKHQNKSLWQLLLITPVIVLIFCTISTAPAQTVPEIAEKALAATVYLEMQDSNGKTLGFGSGFFVKPNLIATNYHVIAGASSGTAKLVGKYTTYKIEGFTATDEDNDLALLNVSAYGIKPLLLGKSDDVKIGETVYVAGNPKGLEGTFSDGIISSRRDKYTKERFQMTAPISPGSSGGPVLNSKGEVIGVSVAAHRDLDAQNLNFAIPSNYLKTLLMLSKPAKPLGQANQTISAETYFRRGNTCSDLGLYNLAIANYDKAIQLKPDHAGAYNNRGLAKAELSQYFAAISDYNKAIQLEPNDVKAYNNRGLAKAGLGQYFTAISDYDKAIQLKPDHAKAYYNRGLVKGKLGQHFAAISDYDKAIQLKPDDALAYSSRGNAKGKLGQHFAAISDFDKAIQLKPDHALAYNNRGIAKAELGQHFAAISDFDKAIQLKPDGALEYYNRGLTKAELGQHFAAISDYDKAIQLKPNYADAYNNRGFVKSKLGQHFAAISDYDKAIQLKPDHASAYYNRGRAKMLLNRMWEAKRDLRKALRLAEKTNNTSLVTGIEKMLRLLE